MEKKLALLISFLVLILSAFILIASASQISPGTIESILNDFFDVFAFIVIGIVGIVYSVKKTFQQF